MQHIALGRKVSAHLVSYSPDFCSCHRFESVFFSLLPLSEFKTLLLIVFVLFLELVLQMFTVLFIAHSYKPSV